MTGKEKLNDLLTEFDEMGYCPTTLCNDPDAAARDWKVRVCCAISQIERETRKETAKHILNAIDWRVRHTEPCELPYNILIAIRMFAKKYGVEVEQ